MPAYTLGEIMSEATYGAGRRADFDASRVSFWANEAGMEVAQAYPTALSEKTAFLSFASGTAVASLPTDFDSPILFSWMSGGSGTTLTRVSPGVVDSMGTAGGIPTHFCFFGSSIEVRPIPNSAMTVHVRYRRQWEDMTSTSSTPSLSTPWRRAIVDKLEAKLHAKVGNAQGEALAMQRYLSYVQSLPSDDARRQQGQWPQGVSMPGY